MSRPGAKNRGRGATARGLTLIELSVSLAVLGILMAGITAFLVTQGKMGAGSFDRSAIQRGGRGALSLLDERLGMAGLGVPRELAIRSLGTEACGATSFPRLEVASVDYLRQWTVASTAAGAMTLSGITNGPPPNPSPGGASADVAFSIGQWLYLYRSAAPGGHGFAKVTAARAALNTGVTLGDTNYAVAQSSLDLAGTGELNNAASGRPLLAFLADVSAFGVNCTDDAAHPYLYWERLSGVRTPVASNVSTPSVGGAVGLVFRFFLDTDGDGQPNGAPVTSLTFDADPDDATNDDVVAIEVEVRIRSDQPDPASNQYRVERFVRRIALPNLHTTTTQYIFIDNSGI